MLVLTFGLCTFNTFGQYFSNPSFEGAYPNPNESPPGWEKCTGSPDTQPLVWDVPTDPSEGDSYVGMCWLPYWVERIWTPLSMSFKADSCYKIEIDLAFYDEINYYGDLQTTFPMKIQILSSQYYCTDGDVLWESPYVDHFNWLTYDFILEPETDIDNIMIRTYYDQTMPEEIGYMLMDNIIVSTPPDLDLGNDTTICNNDSILLYPGPGFSDYVWSDGSGDSVLYATEPGVYWVEGITDYGCSRYDSILVEQSPDIDLGPDTTLCIGDTMDLSAGEGFESYMWFNGSSDSTLQLWDVGQYLVWVVVTDSLGCIGIDSLHLYIVDDSTTVDLGPDTLVCQGSGFTLYPGFYTEYLWQDGSSDSVFQATEPGEYWVSVLGDCGVGSDTVTIDFFPEIELDLGEDTLVCSDISLLLDAGPGFEDYIWHDSTSAQTCEVNSTGIYWVTVSDEYGCQATDSVYITLSPAVVVSLGPDTTICSGEDFLLNPGEGFTSYQWQDGSSNPFYQVVSPGLFWVEVTDEQGCSGSDSVFVALDPSPVVNLGSDTTICSGSALVLDPGSQYSSYLWQDNSTLPVYTANNSGFYSVTVTNIFNCPATDEIYIEFSNPQVNLGGDTILCLGDTLFLDAGSGFNNYFWQDSSTQQLYTVTDGGIYFVEVTDQNGCTGQDAIEIEPVPKPVADLGGDQPLCMGDVLILDTPQGPYNYLWNGSPGGTFIEVDAGGLYTVEVSNQCGVATDQITVTEYPVPDVDLGEDQLLLIGESIELDAGEGFSGYLWQDGSNGQYFVVTYDNADPDNPYYFVEVSDGPCKNSDTTKVELLSVKIPNVFTPNGDGYNDTFTPMDGSWSGVSNHHISIFNRWGEMVWESDNFESGWDGKRNGSYVSEGTYYWVLEIFYGTDEVAQTIKGTVTVLRGS